MPIRDIARELYRLQKEVEKLERELEITSPQAQENVRRRLRRAEAEKHRMRRILDGRIDR